MENLFNQLILTESKESFFEVLSKHYGKAVDESFLISRSGEKEMKGIIKLYHLMFHNQEESVNYPALLMRGLLEKGYAHEKDALVIYELLKKQAGRFFQLAIIRSMGTSNLMRLCHQLEKLEPQLLWMIKEEQAVLIFTFNHGPFVSEMMRQTMVSMLESHQCRMYLSYPYDQFVDSTEFYRQTKLFADIETNHQEAIVEFETSYLHTLFASVHHRQFLSSLIHPNIKRMMAHDEKYHTPYYQTLKTYLACHRDIQRTSELLNINRSTLFYRFKQIGKMLGQDFYQLDLFAFEFSIHIYEFLKN